MNGDTLEEYIWLEMILGNLLTITLLLTMKNIKWMKWNYLSAIAPDTIVVAVVANDNWNKNAAEKRNYTEIARFIDCPVFIGRWDKKGERWGVLPKIGPWKQNKKKWKSEQNLNKFLNFIDTKWINDCPLNL